MTRRTRAWLGLIALAVVLGTATLAAVRVGVLTGGAFLAPPEETVRIALPDRGGRLILTVSDVPWLAPYSFRHVAVERAGQRIIDTPLFPSPLDDRDGLAVRWIAAQGRDGPYVRLIDPRGDILLDLRGFQAWRVTVNGDLPWLAAPAGVMAAGHVEAADGTLTMTAGRPMPQMAGETPGRLLGRVLHDDDGTVIWTPTEAAPAASAR